MSFVKKAVKKIFKFGKKLIKKTGKFLKRAWKNKWVRAALMVALTVFTAGVAAGGFAAFSGVNTIGGFFSAVGTTMANGFTAIGNFITGKGFTLAAGDAAAAGTTVATTTATEAATAAGATTAAEAGAAGLSTAGSGMMPGMVPTSASAANAAAVGGESLLSSTAAGSQMGIGVAGTDIGVGAAAGGAGSSAAGMAGTSMITAESVAAKSLTSKIVSAITSPLKSLFVAEGGGLNLGGYMALSGALSAWQADQAHKDAWDDYYKRLSNVTVWGGGAWGDTEFDVDSVIRPPTKAEETGDRPDYMASTARGTLLTGGGNTQYNQSHSGGILQGPTPVQNLATLQQGLMG